MPEAAKTTTKKSTAEPGKANPRRRKRNIKEKTYPTIQVEVADGKTIELPQYVTMRPGRLLWEDPRSDISLNVGDFDRQYAEIYDDMDLTNVVRALRSRNLVPFNPKEDKMPYTKANAINPTADLSILRNDDSWVALQSGSERQILNEIRRVTDQTSLERMFKYEAAGMNPLNKSRTNIIDLLVEILKKKGSLVARSMVQREATEEITVRM
tara:strand:+ start:64 stop:696 length:633 start_codon:yes stop_codon:yes gene_type:complete